jgi:hypothetical protein
LNILLEWLGTFWYGAVNRRTLEVNASLLFPKDQETRHFDLTRFMADMHGGFGFPAFL